MCAAGEASSILCFVVLFYSCLKENHAFILFIPFGMGVFSLSLHDIADLLKEFYIPKDISMMGGISVCAYLCRRPHSLM